MAAGSKEIVYDIIENKMWCYADPNGEFQTRSLQDTKGICRDAISYNEWNGDKKITYKDYEKAGYKLCRVLTTIKVIK